MRLSFRLAAVKDRRKKKKKVRGKSNVVKDDSRFVATYREIPEEILIEILVRLPADSLMRFKCVSKLWSSLISSRYFTNLFFKFSSSRKRERVFFYSDDLLFSSSLDATASSFPRVKLNHDLTLPKFDRLEFVNALRGLMCFRVDREIQIQIINYTTRQVLSLPLVESNMSLESSEMWNYFGYDHVKDEYKVLSTISEFNSGRVRSETQVLVLGDGASWRNTKSRTSPPPPHHPNDGISINGVLYYGVWSHEEKSMLMSFDFNSEDFSLIKFPVEGLIKWVEFQSEFFYLSVELMIYRDKVAMLDPSRIKTEYILDLWVLEDARESNWSHKFFILPCHQLKLRLDYDYLSTSRSGEVRFSKMNARDNKSIQVIYDLEKNQITKKFVIEPSNSLEYFFLYTYLWYDVESIMYLEA